MLVPQTKNIYTLNDFDSLGFHDCYIHGIRWEVSTSSLILDLDYIVAWIEADEKYKFWVAPAELRFDYASDVILSLDWTKSAMECSVQDVHRHECKATPNGNEDYRWEIEFATPYGSIEFWSTNFELKIQAEPSLLDTQRLRGAGLVKNN